MLTRYVALVAEKSSITASELTKVAAALQKQAVRDLGPIWGIEATVDAFTKLEDVPLDYWPIIVKDDIGDPSAAGFHDDEQGQPFCSCSSTRAGTSQRATSSWRCWAIHSAGAWWLANRRSPDKAA